MAEQLWTPQDDQLLKNLVETYGNNWHLIADCFNSVRYAVSTDVRTNWDCYHRFAATNSKQEPDQSPNQMTTRTKRHSTLGIDTSGANAENKKRRRHLVVLDSIRRLAKKKDSVAKMLGKRTSP